MVVCPKRGLSGLRALPLLTALACLPAAAQTVLTLEQVGARKPPDYSAAYAGRRVLVRGTVSSLPYHFQRYTVLAIEDGAHGAALHVPAGDSQLDALHPGDEIEAQGTVTSLAGMVTVLTARVKVAGEKPPPAPTRVRPQDLVGFHHLGRMVRTESRIKEIGDTTAGAYVLITTPAGLYRVFLPQPVNQQAPRLAGLNVGDKVQVTGLAFQYCPRPPYDQMFELLVRDPGEIVLVERSWFLPPSLLAEASGALLLIVFLVWNRERRLRRQRERLRRTYQLGEQILGASSTDTILKSITAALPRIVGVTRVQLYIYNRASKTLDQVPGEAGPPVSISLSSPPGGPPAGAVACFHYRTLLVIPDIDRSPFPIASEQRKGMPKSLLFVPMASQGEVIGVLELDRHDHAREFSADEQALAQNIGNQIGVAVRLLDQRSVQEQLFRTEKLAAVGRLISGVVKELQTPLSSISELASKALDKPHLCPAQREITAIASEAQKAAAMVARLVAFAGAEQVEARAVNITALLRNLIEFREGDWKASGIRVRNLVTYEPLFVLGSQGQLEQVFLNLLVHAEQSLADAPQKVISLRTSVLGKRLVVEVAFTAPAEPRQPQEIIAAMGVTQSVLTGHGGEVRLIQKSHADPHFEVELPVMPKERAGAAPSAKGVVRDFSRLMTALVIEPEEAAQRQIVALLAARGYRVVPVNNADAALELAQRLRFDAALCSVHAPGLNWVELSEGMQSRVGGFILLSDGYDAELCADFEGDGRFVLAKPVQEAELDAVLRSIEPILSSGIGAA